MRELLPANGKLMANMVSESTGSAGAPDDGRLQGFDKAKPAEDLGSDPLLTGVPSTTASFSKACYDTFLSARR